MRTRVELLTITRHLTPFPRCVHPGLREEAMTAWLPPNLLAYFTPREPLKYAPPLDHLPWDTKAKPYTGVGQYASLFEVRSAWISLPPVQYSYICFI